MILIDTSVWINHLRFGDPVLSGLLEDGEILTHPVVIGELALGSLSRAMLDDLLDLPSVIPADDEETLHFIRRNALAGSGVGYADACLLASARLTGGASLWTRDRRLLAAAERLGLAAAIDAGPGVQE
jgi:predicted nucleic acid-binding protein